MTERELAAWVTASCSAQGVPVKVTDPATVARVALLLGVSERHVRVDGRDHEQHEDGCQEHVTDGDAEAHAATVRAPARGCMS